MLISTSSSGGFDNITKWLKDVQNATPKNAFNKLGMEGVDGLRRNTPADTGETASMWDFKIVEGQGSSELVFINTAHSHTDVNIAKLIRLGYVNGTGGYVPPRDYITPAMSRVYSIAGDMIMKELLK